MGVPKFAAWLTKKYPAMVSRGSPVDVHGLYVDLNGLIHPCCHDEHDPSVAKRPEAEKLRQICLAVEVLVVTTRPQHVVYIAIDGVAPRAKMNQQRARRYMSSAVPLVNQHGLVASLEKEFTEEDRLKAERELEEAGAELLSDPLYGAGGGTSELPEELAVLPGPDLVEERPRRIYSRPPPVPKAGEAGEEDPETKFDSNCLSPGTEFMTKVAEEMRKFLAAKMEADDPLWGGLTVVFSDANVPGEGEHKLIDFLRTQSSHPGFNGHGAHVLAGLDADLIFLTLSLHIPRVFILRDNKRPSSFESKDDGEKKTKKGEGKGKKRRGGDAADGGAASDDGSDADVFSDSESLGDDDGTIALGLIPAADMKLERNLTYEYYDIDEVGRSWLSEVYQLSLTRGFRFKAGELSPTAQANLYTASNGYDFSRLGGEPDGEVKNAYASFDDFHPCTCPCNSKVIDDLIVMAMIMGNDFLPRVPSAFCGESAMDSIMEMYVSDVLPYGYLTMGNHEIDLLQLQRFLRSYAKVEAMKFRQFCIGDGLMTPEEAACDVDSDKDRRCWRDPYYSTTSIKDRVDEACGKYVEGLRFVWRYYSCTSLEVSWTWYYPFHHGPFALDIAKFLAAYGPDVQQRLPAPPVERVAPLTSVQLLCILPPRSRHLVAAPLRRYMVEPPPDLADTFPRRWEVDYAGSYGKDHLATVMLPFANLTRLAELVDSHAADLSPEEQARQRNVGFHVLFRRKRADGADGTSYHFNVQGDGVSALDAAALPWTPPATSADVEVLSFRDTVPLLSRTRTYAHTVVIPNLTVVGPNGEVAKPVRRPRADRGSNTGKLTASKEKAAASSDAVSTEPARTPPTMAETLFFLGAAAVLTSVALSPFNALLHAQVLAVTLVTSLLAFLFAAAVPYQGKIKGGSAVRRNTIRFTYVDWQCPVCLSHNFSRNNRCFICDAPFDAHKAWATFQGKNPPDPPLMDPFHDKYCEPYGMSQ